jgi:hypothetical protein
VALDLGRWGDTDRPGAFPLEGGWARIERFFAKGYGQTVAW